MLDFRKFREVDILKRSKNSPSKNRKKKITLALLIKESCHDKTTKLLFRSIETTSRWIPGSKIVSWVQVTGLTGKPLAGYFG